MGYHSEVDIAVSFDNAETLREVMAAYAMHPKVQEFDLAKDWTVRHDTILHLKLDGIKWYEGYEDVKAYQYMEVLLNIFHKKRGIPYAYNFIRIGEEYSDVETHSIRGDDDISSQLMDMLWDAMHVVRYVDFYTGPQGDEINV